MAGNTPRGIRKRLDAAGAPRYQVRYLVRDATSASGWVEMSATFATLREAKAFKAERDNEAALGTRRFDTRLGRIPLARIWQQYSASKKPAVSPKTWSGYTQHWQLRIATVAIHTEVFMNSAIAHSAAFGRLDLQFVAVEHPIAAVTDDELKRRATALVDSVAAILVGAAA